MAQIATIPPKTGKSIDTRTVELIFASFWNSDFLFPSFVVITISASVVRFVDKINEGFDVAKVNYINVQC